MTHRALSLPVLVLTLTLLSIVAPAGAIARGLPSAPLPSDTPATRSHAGNGRLSPVSALAAEPGTPLAASSSVGNYATATDLFRAHAIAVGDRHTCAVTSVGSVKCWGTNWIGQLGDGTDTPRHTPVEVSGLSSGVIAVVAGATHNCALTSAGGVKCWGSNAYGQLGDGTDTPRLTPVEVSGLTSEVTAIAAGDDHTCALTSAGRVKCWGRNDYGQLGDGTTGTSDVPVPIRW